MTKQEQRQWQSRDKQTRIDNLVAKLDLLKYESDEREAEYRRVLNQKDAVIAMLQKDNLRLSDENAVLKNELADCRQRLETFEDETKALRAMLKKDSTNSSKPPSTDGLKKPRVFSTNEQSGRKPGGQKGHLGHTLELSPNPTRVIDRNPSDTCECGGAVQLSDGYEPKQVKDLRIVVDITEERRYSGVCNKCGKVHRGEFSAAFINPVQYGSGLKAIVAALNAYNNTTVGKTAEFIESITGGEISISHGTVVNILHGLSESLDGTIQAIADGLANCEFMGVDETGARSEGRLTWIQIFANNLFTLFTRNETRGTAMGVGQSLLLLFTGILAHDHLKSYYKLENVKHAECNVHILRYLVAVIEILKHGWATAMSTFLKETNKLKHELMEAGKQAATEEQIAQIRKRYLEILDQGDAEYLSAVQGKKNITHYNDERLLLKRLREFMDAHLLFLVDFAAPFGNNGAEQGARFFKSKLRSAGCFRSKKGEDDYARVASLIATLRKQHINVFSTIKDLFDGIEPTFISIDNVA